MYTSLDQFLEELPVHAAKHRDDLRGHDALFLVQTKQGRTIYIQLKDGDVIPSDTASCQPACTVIADERTLLDMLNGTLNPLTAILFRKITLKGDPTQLLALARLV